MDFARAQQLIKPQRGERLKLGLRNLYILPTRFGLLWLAGGGLLLLVAIQTQRNGPLLLSFLMLGLWLLALHLTQFNLQGLELEALAPSGGFAGEMVAYPLLCRSRCQRDGIQLGLAGSAATPQPLAAGESVLSVPWRAGRRGLQTPGRLRLQTTAPLGLFVCWTLWEPPRPQPIYPARRPGPVAESSTSRLAAGSDDWDDLRPHRPQDGLARVAWKSLAQGRGRQTKTFAAATPAVGLLAPAPGLPPERALEHLSAEIWRRSKAGEAYGLALGDTQVAPNTGPEHRDRCLLALALAPGAAS
ncbi:hypothetical protein OGCDGJMD_02808 [Cyanobium usitatum str. Tous]|jgi:uncharacterized protein (DUF58 family)|uniref:hypothetical protein n=1 Tax=Cyanobium usitatum TaxID=2304190 RepID=UPI002AD24924|nr:hypothetical protein [Cyanobium usitatum]CAK6700185.1 hypothetical protein OGCDGJMD_02808 [Cyanobium usitatum str. Tous]